MNVVFFNCPISTIMNFCVPHENCLITIRCKKYLAKDIKVLYFFNLNDLAAGVVRKTATFCQPLLGLKYSDIFSALLLTLSLCYSTQKRITKFYDAYGGHRPQALK